MNRSKSRLFLLYVHTNPLFAVAAEIYKALASERRLTILLLLSRRPYCVSDLAEELGISIKATSRHLHILRRVGLVESVRKGEEVEFSIAPLWNLLMIFDPATFHAKR